MLPRQEYILATLQACVTACQQTNRLVAQQPDDNQLSRAARLSLDCADLCQLTAAFVVRDSEHLIYVLRECAELCRTCADEQARHAAIVATCRQGEQACRRAEDACRTAYH
ncbi:four-helix bundle copper-binding protein [Hymenobacter sp. YC55]|uniref:four-helix bundle copper-binding protein n=1 Tax=Hymenobacter sp. YC55 TaxID=3034019 RepID=UPI0023F70826|nr:four-helix bundle copper-binding protein [Hymenobacter sp. YC55]MDF7814775.1 four-helix bundle copper-binding protein [Hymenobacter sp. YC55]